MRLAFISDIHGNYYALKAVLEYLTREEKVVHDRIICLGDILAGHGGSELVMALLDEYNVELVKGNHDELVVPWDIIPEHRLPLIKCIANWEDENITAETRDRLDHLPVSMSVVLEDGRTLFVFHSNPDDIWDMVNGDDVPNEKMIQVFNILPGDVLVYGHYHMNHVMEFGEKLLVNTGSVSGTVSIYPNLLAHVTTMLSLPDRLVIRQESVSYDAKAQLELDKATNAPFWQFRNYLKNE